MSTEEDTTGTMGFHHRIGEGIVNTNQVSEKAAMSSGSMFKSSGGPDPFFGSGWDPIASLSHSENFGGSSSGVTPHSGGYGNSPFSVMMESQGMPMPSSTHHFHYPADSGLVEMVPKFYGSGGFSAMVGASFGLPDPSQIANFIANKDTAGNTSRNGASSQGDQHVTEEGKMRISPCGKRKKGGSETSSPYNPSSKNGEGDQQNDGSGDSSENPRDLDEKKQKTEQTVSGNTRGKQKAKDSSNSGEAPKDSYIHVRARRGQATNSHSLAERVRRERISERMRLLQELVPGCNKITGKAVMLDEIINYVQSLQQQVEFLSMKLATVNPQLNVDIDRILSKEILQSRGNTAGLPGFIPGMSSSHPYTQGIPRGALQGMAATSPFNPMPQNVWDTDLQSLLQMGFESNPAISNMGPNGQSKLEL